MSENMSQFTPAWFISPHGFGHTARACAVMAALRTQTPNFHPHIFTTAPEWFFADALTHNYTYHSCMTDVGMVQTSPLHEDVDATLRALDAFMPFSPTECDTLADTLTAHACSHVITDISPLGIAVAEHAHLPVILIENFTWDWIYRGYVDVNPRMAYFAELCQEYYARATHRVQTEPLTVAQPCSLHAPPISRARMTAPETTRAALDVPMNAPLALISMGGIAQNMLTSDTLRAVPECIFILPTHDCTEITRAHNIIRIPWHSTFRHQDLVAAANLVIGKLGYSTIAEVYNEGTAFAYFTRKRFCESPPLAAFVAREIPSVELPDDVTDPAVLRAHITPLLSVKKTVRTTENGADVIARFLLSLQ